MRCRIQKELNALDHVIMEAKCGAENQCQKLKIRIVQWCLQVTTAINKILFWKSILKWELGGKVGLSIIQTRAQKAWIDLVPYPSNYQIETLQELILKAYKQFNWLKRDDNRCNTWMAWLILVPATAWNKTKRALWQQMWSTERICHTANNVRKALKISDSLPLGSSNGTWK